MNGLIMTLTSADERLLFRLIGHRRRYSAVVMRGITRLADPRVVLPLAMALALGVVPELKEAGSVALWSLVTSHLFVQLLKRRICRARPSLPVGLSFLIEPEDRYSFPSGHATAALSVTLPLTATLGGLFGTIVLVLGVSVGVSRCYLGVHYPSDVVVGWTLAGATVVVVGLLTGVPL